MNKSTFQAAAAAMVEMAATGHVRVRRSTPAGTVVIERQDDGRVSLCIERQDRPPSMEEVAAVCELFGVPAGTEPTTLPQRRIHPRTRRLVNYYVSRMSWME